jgi:hypothetical protein
MNIRLFNKNYWIRRFGEQRNVKGYMTSSYEDLVISANVHPSGSDQMQAQPEGERKVKRLEAQSEDTILTADETANRRGDLLFYYGNWYECVSAQVWDHTILSHTDYQFVLVPTDASGELDLDPPDGEPGRWTDTTTGFGGDAL